MEIVHVAVATNDVTHQRQCSALRSLTERSADQRRLVRVLFGAEEPQIGILELPEMITWRDNALNDSQKAAVSFAMASRDVALIHGPPVRFVVALWLNSKTYIS